MFEVKVEGVEDFQKKIEATAKQVEDLHKKMTAATGRVADRGHAAQISQHPSR